MMSMYILVLFCMEADNLLGDNVEGDNMQDVKHTNVSVLQNLDAGASQEPGPANVESEQGGEFVAHDDMGQPIEDEPTPVTEIVHSSDLQSLLAQNAWLTHTNQNLEEELTDIREKFKELSAKNSELQSQVTSSANDLNERSRLYRQLESARNDLAIKKIQLDCDVEKLKHEKEERDTAVKTLTKEKHLLATENFGLKDQLQQISNEKAALHLEKKTQEQEIRTMNFERERARLDKDMFAESKKWFLQEIAERDSKVSQLRIEMSSKELSWQRERLSLNDDIARLQLIAEEHEAQIQLKKSRTEELIARIEEISAEHRQALSDMEAELRSKTELANLYKDSLEKSEHVAAELNEQWQAREGLFEETKQVLVEVRQEMEEEKKAQQEEISSRDAQIAELKDELQKANDLLKSKHAVHLNVTEEELSVLSPAAAETARLLKGGQSLTSIIREHARLAGKLAESREQNRQLELTMREMVEEIEERAPQLLHQKDVLDQTFDQNNLLQDQLKDADEQRRRLEGQRDAANRELAFTRAELEKYQRDHAKLGKQVQHLLFVIERERFARDSDSPPPSEADDRILFDNVGQLQKRNMQLESELASERALAAQAMQSAQNSELDRLKRDLKRAQIGEANLKTELDQMNTTFRTLREQAESLKKLAEDNVSAAEARASKLKAEDAVSQARASEMKVSRLEEHIKLLKDEKEKVERIQEDRVARSEQIVAEVKMTNARLETSFEMQKQTAAAVVKELEKVQKECDQIRSENDRLRSVDVQHAAEIQKLHSEMMELQGKYSEYKIKYRSASEELEHSRRTTNRLETELESLKRSLFNEQQMMISLNEVTARLARVESERMGHVDSQLDVLRLERDSLKTSSARLADQLTHARNETKQIQTRLEQEFSLAKQQLVEKETELAISNKQLVELRARLATVQAQYTAQDTTIGMTPERLQKECQQLKNRTQYLESQVDELKEKLMNAETEAVKRNDENQRISSHSGVLETNLRQITELGTMERERLEARAQAAEARSEQLSSDIVALREKIGEMEIEFNKESISHLQERGALVERADVLEIQLKDANSSISALDESLKQAREEIEKRLSEVNMITESLSEVSAQLSETKGKCEILETKLMSKNKELFNAEEAARVAEEGRLAIKQVLTARSAEIDANEVKWRETAEQYEQKLEQMIQQYEKAISIVGDPSTNVTNETLTDPDTPNTMIESLQSVIRFLREEKQLAVTRSMNAEVEMKRLRAETNEIRVNRDEMVARLNRLEAESVAASDALAERTQLMERLESMASTQRQNMMLRMENEKLHKVSSELLKQKQDLETKQESLNTQLSDITMKITMLNGEVTTRRRENDLLKQRLEQIAKTHDVTLQADLEQCKSRLSRMEAELKTAGEQAVQAEQQKIAAETTVADLDLKHKEVSAKFSQTRQLAIKFRTELTEEKKKTSQLSAEIASLKCNLSTGESSSDKSSGTTKQEDLQFVVASLNERLNALEGEKKKLEVDLASKLAENEEVKFRLNLLTPTVEKATSRVTKLTEERDALKEQIAKLEAEVVSKSVPPVSISLTSVASNMPNSERTVLDSEVAMAASIPKRIAFDSPVRSIPITTSRTPMPQVSQPTIQGASVTIASYPTVPKLFKTTTASSLFIPQTTSSPVRLSDNINTTIPTEVSTPQSITFSFATSSAAPRISPGQSLFGKSAPVPATNVTTSSSANTTREELIDQAVVTEAEQSSQVSGSVEAATDEVVDDDGMAQNDSAGESRDSTAGMPVSSSDGSRKRPAPDVEASDVKRQRDSPSEIVTSSEERKDIQRGTLELHPEDDVNEVVELDEPDVVEDNDVEEIDDGVEQEPLSDEDVSEHDMEEFEDDEGDDDEEDGGANDADGGDDEVVVLSGESDDEEEDVGEIEEDDDGGNDDEVLGADENLQSQPSLEDQDREAASAVEEADDEGRESANSRPSTATSAPASSDAPRLRIPIVYDRDDQCSSSNETGAVPQRLGLPVQRQTARRARPVRAIYQRGATRGRGNGRAQ